MNKTVANYIGRKPVRIPTERHGHNYSDIYKVSASQVRFSCTDCPSITNWFGIKYLSESEQKRVNTSHFLSAMQRAVRSHGGTQKVTLTVSLHEALTATPGNSYQPNPDAAWTTDSEGRTPDELPSARDMDEALHEQLREDNKIEQPNIGGFYGNETVPRPPKPHTPPQYTPDHSEAEDDEVGSVMDELMANAKQAVQEFGDVAIKETKDQIRTALSSMSKPELMEAYPNVGLFKSWTKDKMIEAIIEHETTA